MISTPKMTIEEIIKVIKSEEELPLETETDKEFYGRIMVFVAERLNIPPFSAEQAENITLILRTTIKGVKSNLIEKFEKIRDDSL